MPSDISNIARAARHRALLYVFDGGSGIGHLRRIAHIAAAMQERFSCLIVTGHDVGPQWIVPPGCEYVRLPSWDKLIPGKAAYWGRAPFLNVPLDEAVQFRRAILEGVVAGFQPDVLLVDHLPLGAHAELGPLIRNGNFHKYLITRGVQNETEDLQRLVLGGEALESLRRNYSRIFSAIDQRIFDFSRNYGLGPDIIKKISATGYVASPAMARPRERARAARGVDDRTLWVVASAGGGQWGENLMDACLALTDAYPAIHFDIIAGPRSKQARPADDVELRGGGRVRLHSAAPNLADFHAGADLVVTTGGYNSLMETLQGQARIVCVPYRKDPADEPVRHANCLKQYVDLQVETDVSRLPELFAAAIQSCQAGPAQDRRRELDLDGANQIAHTIFNDLLAAKVRQA